MSIRGKTVAFTGKISKPRHEFEQLVVENGGRFGTSVTSNTDYLVVGEKPGSKLAAAVQLGTPRLTEREFLELLKDESTDETPLTKEELAELESHMTERTCKWCSKKHKQFDTVPDYGTCPVCEILTNVRCPYCSNEHITFVEDFSLYHCNCGEWFEAPYSAQARKTKHLHMWVKTVPTKDGVKKECICGQQVRLTNADLEHSRRNYEMYPTWVKKWRQEAEERRIQEERERRQQEWFESLSEEQIDELRRQVNGEENILHLPVQ